MTCLLFRKFRTPHPKICSLIILGWKAVETADAERDSTDLKTLQLKAGHKTSQSEECPICTRKRTRSYHGTGIWRQRTHVQKNY